MQIKFYLLQNPRIEVNNQRCFDELNMKSLGLLLYLAMNNKKKFSREELSELFWPNQSSENARSNLRQVLSGIKKNSGAISGLSDSIITSNKGNCYITEDCTVWVDVLEFNQCISKAKACTEVDKKVTLLRTSVDYYESRFLEGFYVKGSLYFEEWLMYERESLERRFTSICKELSSLYIQHHELSKAVEVLSKLLKINPLQEDIYQELIKVHLQSKNRAGAIAAYKQCIKILRKELNIGPMDETRELYQVALRDLSMKNSNDAASPDKLRDRNLSRVICSMGEASQILKDITTNFDGKKTIIALRSIPEEPLGYEIAITLLRELLEQTTCSTQIQRSAGLFLPQYSSGGAAPIASIGQEMYLCELLKLALGELSRQVDLVLLFEGFDACDPGSKKIINHLWNTLSLKNLYIILAYVCTEKLEEDVKKKGR